MSRATITIIMFIVGIIIGFTIALAIILPGANKVESELARTRQSLESARARAYTAERGLGEAIEEVGRITDRNKRITILVDTIRATIKQLRAIYQED